MAEQTKIQWTDHTFNPWRGCTKVAAGCANCYADKQSKRNPKTLGIWGDDGTRVVAAEAQWRQVEKWNREADKTRVCHDCGHRATYKDNVLPACLCERCGSADTRRVRPRVFVGSLMDVFEGWQGPMVDSHGDRMAIDPDGKWLPVTSPQYGDRWITMDDVRARLFRLIDACPHLDFLMLTKRPENILDCWNAADPRPAGAIQRHRGNVWLIASASTQAGFDRNVEHLVRCRDLSSVLGMSLEPLVESINIDHWQEVGSAKGGFPCLGFLSWIIVGGESGPNARPYNVDWARSIIRQCKSAGVACFHKQLGSYPCPMDFISDPKGGDPSEWPEGLRVREFPDDGGSK